MQEIKEIEKNIEEICRRVKRINELLLYEEVTADKKLYLQLSKEKVGLLKVSDVYEKYLKAKNDLELAYSMLELPNSDRQFLLSEIEVGKEKVEKFEREVIEAYSLLNAKVQKIIVQIDGCGGDLAESLSANICLDIEKLASDKGFGIEKIEDNAYGVCGLNVKEYYLDMVGYHYIQNKNADGKCFVYVLDDDVEFKVFDEKDVRIDTLRSSGAGGQHINTTDSAVRATHIQTGISVVCGEERSQIQNKDKALSRLKERVDGYYKKIQQDDIKSKKKKQLLENKNVIKTHGY